MAGNGMTYTQSRQPWCESANSTGALLIDRLDLLRWLREQQKKPPTVEVRGSASLIYSLTRPRRYPLGFRAYQRLLASGLPYSPHLPTF